MRRGAGISALSRQTTSTASYATLSNAISANQIADLRSQLESFRSILLDFSKKHKEDIKRDPALRHQFQKMCAGLGLDPLAGGSRPTFGSSSFRGLPGTALWSDLFSGLSDWQYELAVQIVDVCVSTRERNGGMIEMDDLLNHLHRLRNGGKGEIDITPEDVIKSIKALKPLEAGYEVIHLDPFTGATLPPTNTSIPFSSSPISKASGRTQTFIRSISSELGTDQAILLGLASESNGRLNERRIAKELGWTEVRARSAFDTIVKRDGLAWIDGQAGEENDGVTGWDRGVDGGWTIWVPSAIKWEEI